MVQKFQELDDNDPTPYQGGYDIHAAYGGVKAADAECGYYRAEVLELLEAEPEYGNESNPYEGGPPGPSIFTGRSKPGDVYGGGRDRTLPSHDEAQRDEAVETGHGPAYSGEAQAGFRTPSFGQEEHSAYWMPISYGYGEEELGSYRNPRPPFGSGEEEGGYRAPISHGDGEEGLGYRNPWPAYGEEETDDSGCRKPAYGYGEEGPGYRKLRPGDGDEERDESGYRKPPAYGYAEQESWYRNPWPAYGEVESSSGYHKPYNYEEEEESWYRRPGPTNGGELGSGYGGYGGRSADDDVLSHFFGGSVYTQEPVPKQSPTKRSFWW